MKLLSSLLTCILFPPLALPQEGKVIVVNAVSKEMKRTAHRLHISLDQLKNARSALHEATELAKGMESASAMQLDNLAQCWVDVNRTKAADAIAGLIVPIRKSAASATGLPQYQHCADRAQVLITALATVDAEAALQFLRGWPAPPLASGEAGDRTRNRLQDQCRNRIIRQLAYFDPVKADELARESGSASASIYSVRAQQIAVMVQEGRQYDAQQLADQWIAEFKQYQAAPGAFQDYLIFLRQLAVLDPNRFIAGVASGSALLSSAFAAAPPWGVAGDQNVPITNEERSFLMMFRARPQPELMLKALDLLPGLKAKAEQAGGIDVLMTARRPVNQPRTPAGSDTRSPSARGNALPNPDALFRELRGKAEKNPGFVRQRLSEVAQDPQHISILIQLAERAAYEDPELGSMALDAAKDLLSMVKSPDERASLMENIARAYRTCDGEAESGLLRDGFILVARMREETRDSAEGETKGASTADKLESFLLAELSRQDFESAMRHVLSMTDKPLKLTALLEIIQSIRQSNWD